MNELKIFNFENREVRTVIVENEPWFVLKDVCDVLELGNSRMVADRLDDDEKGVSLIDTPGGKQNMTIVNESGLYNVILRSDKPQAKPFRKWATSEVLPSIRKHGAYMTAETIEKTLTDPDFIIQLATTLKEEQAKVKELIIDNEIMKPKALFADSVSASEDTVLIKELSVILKQNGIDIGQNRLFELLREEGYLISRRGDSFNLPTQKSLDLGIMKIKKRAISTPSGTRDTRTPVITGKGKVYFVNRYLGKDISGRH